MALMDIGASLLPKYSYTSPMAGFTDVSVSPAASATTVTPDWFKNLPEWAQGAIGTKEQPGWGGLALGGAQSLFNMYSGMKQYGLMKDQLDFSKDAFNKNYAAQKDTLNTQMEDRQRARVASDPSAYQALGDYMATHGIR